MMPGCPFGAATVAVRSAVFACGLPCISVSLRSSILSKAPGFDVPLSPQLSSPGTDFFLESSWVDARLQELGSLELDTLR